MKKVCFCCKRESPTAIPRLKRPPGSPEGRGWTEPLCSPCISDPAIKYADCMHGTPALSDLLKF